MNQSRYQTINIQTQNTAIVHIYHRSHPRYQQSSSLCLIHRPHRFTARISNEQRHCHYIDPTINSLYKSISKQGITNTPAHWQPRLHHKILNCNRQRVTSNRLTISRYVRGLFKEQFQSTSLQLVLWYRFTVYIAWIAMNVLSTYCLNGTKCIIDSSVLIRAHVRTCLLSSDCW